MARRKSNHQEPNSPQAWHSQPTWHSQQFYIQRVYPWFAEANCTAIVLGMPAVLAFIGPGFESQAHLILFCSITFILSALLAIFQTTLRSQECQMLHFFLDWAFNPFTLMKFHIKYGFGYECSCKTLYFLSLCWKWCLEQQTRAAYCGPQPNQHSTAL